MALDGIMIAGLVKELNACLTGGHISKISMPEKDEILILVKNHSTSYRLLVSPSASLPLMYLTDTNRPSPLTAPGFCMLLRKHIGSGKIVSIEQEGLERIVRFTTEQLDELGDLTRKRLYVELMGKYSNLIFTDQEDRIIDSIKHVPASLSSLREVLPGRDYFLPDRLKKEDPLSVTEERFRSLLEGSSGSLSRALCMTFSGISPVAAEELLFRASIEPRSDYSSLTEADKERLRGVFFRLMDEIRDGRFTPVMYLKNDVPEEFSAVRLLSLSSSDVTEKPYDSVSALLHDYYSLRESTSRIRQKSADLRRLVQNALERNSRKYILQEKQLQDSEKKDRFRVYGDLITTFGYSLSEGDKELVCKNYYDEDREIRIPVDPALTPSQNAKKYYDRYSKLKRTAEATGQEILKTKRENEHLSSILTALDLATEESDLGEIREELTEFGYLKRHSGPRKQKKTVSKPLHFVSSDGYDIYVGKNNFQNEELTFKVASGNDWWFHANDIPGSHVIVKSRNETLPDRTFEEAAGLAAYYSKARNSEKVEVDYIQRKHVKKTAGGPPGFVIYHTNWSMMAKPIDRIPEKGDE